MSALRKQKSLEVGPEEGGKKVEAFLAKRLRRVAPGHVAKLIRQQRVEIDRRTAERGDRVEVGQTVVVLPPTPGPTPPPQPNRRLRFAVLHEDPDLVVVGKPARVPVAPGPGHGTNALLNGLVARYPELLELGAEREYGLVHRLDKDTSGLLVVARSAEAYAGMVAAFSAREVEKTYLALTEGVPDPPEGEVELPVDGKPARSRYRVLERAGPVGRVELRPITGRTHQLRIHLASLGAPVLADPVHGHGLNELTARLYQPRLALHAQRIGFIHPVSGAALALEQPVPKDLRKAWRRAQRAFTDAPGGSSPPAPRAT